MRGRDRAHVHGNRTAAADPFDDALLQYAQQHHLGFRGQFADFIEEDRSLMSQFKAARPSFGRAGECPGFMAEPDRCWRMVYSPQLQATHCRETPTYTGRWFSPRGDSWFRVWACPDHLEGLTGLRQFGA